MTPIDTCIMLHDLYTRWDSLAAEIGGIVKVTTIGDAYIAVSGPSFADHGIMSGITKEKGALLAVRMACSMMEEAGRVQAIRNQKLTEMVEEEDEETTVVLGDDDIENLNFSKTTADSVQASRSSDLSDKQGTETPVVLAPQFSSAAVFRSEQVEMVPVKIRIGCATGTLFGAVLVSVSFSGRYGVRRWRKRSST